eukprot:g7539.t1
MRLTALSVLRWVADSEPNVLGQAMDVSNFGFFQRASVREMITFICRTIVQRTHVGQRQTVQHEDYFCHVHVRENHLAGIVVADANYPSRAAFSILAKILDDYEQQCEVGSSTDPQVRTKADSLLEVALEHYQDPLNADKVGRIQKDLDETKIVLHKTIEGVLERGEKLDNLVERSNDLSLASQMFYKSARKTNSCCKMM